MIKYTNALMTEAKNLFPDSTDLHEMMRMGDTKALDFVYSKLGFTVDEDDIVRAFRNKKEMRLLEMAKKAKAIRDFYQKMFVHIDSQEMKVADKLGYQDCI
jgi:hypothetical protein